MLANVCHSFCSEPRCQNSHHELSSWWPCTVWLMVSLNSPRHFCFVIWWCPLHTIFPLSPLTWNIANCNNFQVFCAPTSCTYKIIYCTFNFTHFILLIFPSFFDFPFKNIPKDCLLLKQELAEIFIMFNCLIFIHTWVKAMDSFLNQ